MIKFIVGLLIGLFLGVSTMCIVAVGQSEEDMRWIVNIVKLKETPQNTFGVG
jgi:hypothetical protein